MRFLPLKIPPRGLMLFFVLIAVSWFIKIMNFDQALNAAWVDGIVKSDGLLTDEILFVSTGVLFTGIGLPRQAICFLGGYTFGFIKGTLLSLLASIGGCVGGFTCARLLGRSIILRSFPDKICYLDAFVQSRPFTATLLVRLLPVGSNLFTNLIAGISGIQTAAFLAGSALGYVPQTAVFALLGSGIQIDQFSRAILVTAPLLLSVSLGIWIVHHYNR